MTRHVLILSRHSMRLGQRHASVHALARQLGDHGHSVELVSLDLPLHRDGASEQDPGPRYVTSVLCDRPESDQPRRAGRLLGLDRRRSGQPRQLACRALSAKLATLDQAIVIVSDTRSADVLQNVRPRHLPVIWHSIDGYESLTGTPGKGAKARRRRMIREFRQYDRFLVPTAWEAAQAEQDGFNNVGVLPPALTVHPEAVLPHGSQTVLAVGDWNRTGDQEALLTAFRLAARRHPDWRLRLVGHGKGEQRLRRRAAELKVASRVTFAPPSRPLAEEMAEGAVFVSPCQSGDYPVHVADAMACGLPVVVVDSGPSVHALITHRRNGLITPPHDVRRLASGMRRLMSQPDLARRLGEQGRRDATTLRPEEQAARWEEVFEYVER